ncbi:MULTISPECIES: GNAT family N-acetyltransferase [Arthrobacter]|uniref:GNAT family N-acetyltransferase n=2 Tax=Arthrobacter TaxID=1663 RepID=A0ABU9KGJ9_9MICC|nr:GNAT family N-acetyltransferase [Arthrobacter sp. YJM1]MDP5225661.1 GNAT family N-acetyltransferase [Arthrobacter sp. YJM1]
MTPQQTARLLFREMLPADVDDMARLLGDPDVMHFYPRPKTRAEALDWIEWNRRNYREHGYGLWILEDRDGRFVGDCGLTWQRVNGLPRLEVGYHVLPEFQGHGLATEAASACRDHAREVLLAPELVAIIHPENLASRRVAEKLGMEHREDDRPGTADARTVMAMDLHPSTDGPLTR